MLLLMNMIQVVDNKMVNWGGLAREAERVGELFR